MKRNEKNEKACIRLLLIRHGETAGNLEGKYVGRTDESLCASGRESAKRLGEEEVICNLPYFREAGCGAETASLYVSPLRRCQETAALIFPSAAGLFRTVPDFRECDFGLFEYRNYRELMAEEELAPRYQAWIDSGGRLPFPQGETVDGFKERCVRAFGEIMARETGSCAVFVVHGGTIMSILEEYGEPKKGYYEYQVPCADGFLCDYLPARDAITNIVRLKRGTVLESCR
ncbi:MAG: histidine phosphatase family protein [Lachnospiraceae bacterium]|nr:histidine phosphatase family protein [Lachnospiraceae bacterium]